MLKYIWMVIQDLFLTVTFVTLIHELLRYRFPGQKLIIHWAGIFLGTISAIILSLVKYNTNKIVSSRWNHSIYIWIIGFTLAFTLLVLLSGKKEGGASVLCSLTGSALSAIWIFYSLPSAIAYPFIFNTMGNGYLSWYYIQRVLGWLIAYLILYVYARLLSHVARLMRRQGLVQFVLLSSLLANAGYCACRFFIPWVNRAKWLSWPIAFDRHRHGWAMAMVKFSSRHAMTFLWLVAALVLILIVVFYAENRKIIDPYENPAQLRKLKARGKKRRRAARCLLLFLAMIVVSLTAIKSYDTREVTLSAPETFTVMEDKILVPIDTVSDGHLHRFEYKTDNDINVRWIVVKKPGSAAYGVGLDACEVCGNAGYYERNGQVICKRCDVVMNTNTIGFKGGCNPIPLSYEVEEGNLSFRIEDLVAGEKEFR